MKVLLCGTGDMARSYTTVLCSLPGVSFCVIGSAQEHTRIFAENTGAFSWRIWSQISRDDVREMSFAILAGSIEDLEKHAHRLIELQVPVILIEKPVSVFPSKIDNIAEMAKKHGVRIRVGCNRRYYQSILGLRRLLIDDSPVASYFDFTEWIHAVPEKWRSKDPGKHLALANSIHVFDTLEYLLGDWNPWYSNIQGQNEIEWHSSGAIFSGCGQFGSVPASYQTSWLSPGRWSIDISTRNYKYRLSPMERLQALAHRTVKWEEVSLDYALDEQYKPGLHNMLKDFMRWVECKDEELNLPDLKSFSATCKAMANIVGYSS